MAEASYFKSTAGAQAVDARSRELLRHWPLEKQELELETRHGLTHVLACGSKDNPPLLLFHPAGINLIYWMEQVQTYAQSHRVYAVDLPGEGGRSEARRPAYKGPAYAEWVEDLYRGLAISRAALVGVSFGAWICLKFACAWPEKVDRLALVSPLGIVRRRRARTGLTRLASFFAGGLGSRMVFRSQLKKSDMDPKLRELFQLTQRHLKGRPLRLPRLSEKQLSQLYCPVLMLVGGKDAYLDTDKLILKAAKTLPQLEIGYRPRDGHYLSEFTRELDRFLVTHYAPD